MAEQPEQPPLLQQLHDALEKGDAQARQAALTALPVRFFSSRVRFILERIYGKESPLLAALPTRGDQSPLPDPRAALVDRLAAVRRIAAALEAAPEAAAPLAGKQIFIGHGRSRLWYELKDFLQRLGLPCDEFNLESAAGKSTTERLDEMAAQAGFAFVIMTAEEKHEDGQTYARPNVIHECGLFQGRLTTHRAIILLENGCAGFSNINGLTQIRFPHDNIRAIFEDVRGVLRREGFI